MQQYDALYLRAEVICCKQHQQQHKRNRMIQMRLMEDIQMTTVCLRIVRLNLVTRLCPNRRETPLWTPAPCDVRLERGDESVAVSMTSSC